MTPNVAAYPHDPEKARQMLDAAGYPLATACVFTSR